MVNSSWALILGTAGTPPSLPVKVARLGEPPSWRALSAAAGNLPRPATINRREARDPLWPQRDRPRRRPLHLRRALRSRVTECEHDVRPQPTRKQPPRAKNLPTQPENASTECGSAAVAGTRGRQSNSVALGSSPPYCAKARVARPLRPRARARCLRCGSHPSVVALRRRARRRRSARASRRAARSACAPGRPAS